MSSWEFVIMLELRLNDWMGVCDLVRFEVE